MEPMVAYCGIVCSDCEAYRATQSGDRGELERVAAKWGVAYHLPTATAEDVLCDGCTAGERRWVRCRECPIQACAAGRGLVNCASCDDYPCDDLSRFLSTYPPAKATLDNLRR